MPATKPAKKWHSLHKISVPLCTHSVYTAQPVPRDTWDRLSNGMKMTARSPPYNSITYTSMGWVYTQWVGDEIILLYNLYYGCSSQYSTGEIARPCMSQARMLCLAGHTQAAASSEQQKRGNNIIKTGAVDLLGFPTFSLSHPLSLPLSLSLTLSPSPSLSLALSPPPPSLPPLPLSSSLPPPSLSHSIWALG